MGARGGASLLWLWVLAPLAAGQFGGGGWTPPPPQCPSFKCPAKQKPAPREGVKVWAYGCDNKGINLFDASSFDPNNPLSGMNKKNSKSEGVNRCCVEKEICQRTCGMSAVACHDAFQKCSKKVCKGDQNCNMQVQLAEIMSVPLDDKKDKAAKDDLGMCSVYNAAQKEYCECVPEEDWRSTTESRLKSFYKQYKPDKLDDEGEIKDTASIWKQWKGKEPQMFFELTKKYKDQAVEIRVKPQPKDRPSMEDQDAGDSGAPEAEEPQAESDDSSEFSNKLKDIEARKEQAKKDEDYDLAQQLKDEGIELKRAEIKRLKAEKNAAIEGEDYIKAKKIKRKLAELDPHSEL